MERAKKRVEPVYLYVDGASLGNPGPSGAGGVAFGEDGKEVFSFSVFLGHGTNNEAEYKALIIGLRKLVSMGFFRVVIRSDSQLLVKQLAGDYKVKSGRLVPLFLEVKSLLRGFEGWKVEHIPRSLNRRSDALAKMAAKKGGEAGLSPRKGEESPGSRGQGAP